MKKIVLALIATIMIAGAMMAQTNQKRMILTIASRSSTMGNYVKPGDFIYILGDSVMYVSRVSLGPSATGTYLLGNSSRYHVANMATYAGKGASYWVDTATAQNIHGVKTFYDAPDIKIVGTGGSAAAANLGIGLGVLANVTSGQWNIGIGKSSLGSIVTGQQTTAVGFEAGKDVTHSYNTFLGYYTGRANTSGQYNTYVGNSAGYQNITGSNNTYVGAGAGGLTTSGSDNIVIGHNAGSKVLGSDKLVISNIVGGQDTAIIYGVMSATPADNTLQLNAYTTVSDTLVAPITTVATKLTLPGTSNTITKTTNNANSLTVSNSLSVADTLVAAVATISGTLTGTAALRDTANFGTDASGNRNKYIRKKITGVASTDRFIVVPVMASTTAVPGTAEFLGYYCTTDSLIISRNTASTAGLKVSYVRIK